jgi:glycosyltransferase involved in cell wall biosynthesis
MKAFALPSWHSPRTRVLIIGDGPFHAKLQRLSRELGIDTSTTFLAFVPHQELPLYYQTCDVTVVPSDRYETFCLVALEAIACGCPLIVTGQLPEILRRFPTVPTVAPYDVEDLRRRLDTALDGNMPPN